MRIQTVSMLSGMFDKECVLCFFLNIIQSIFATRTKECEVNENIKVVLWFCLNWSCYIKYAPSVVKHLQIIILDCNLAISMHGCPEIPIFNFCTNFFSLLLHFWKYYWIWSVGTIIRGITKLTNRSWQGKFICCAVLETGILDGNSVSVVEPSFFVRLINLNSYIYAYTSFFLLQNSQNFFSWVVV